MLQQNILNQTQGFIFLFLFWIVAFLCIRMFFKKKETNLTFLVSNRNVGLLLGTITVSIAWVWAPALFVSSQKAYEQGVPGLFWFTLPNAGALILFAFLATRMRKIFDSGFTLPEYMGKRFNRRMELLYSFTIFIVQAYAVIVNLTAALLLLNLVTGIQKESLIVILGLMMVSLSLLKGIRSSFVEDAIKTGMVALVALIIVPWGILATGGLPGVISGIGGVTGKFTNLFDPTIFWTFGIPISISLLSGIVIDQQQWQRAFSIKRKDVKTAFLLGGVIFAVVPIMLGALGYLAANPALNLKILPQQHQLAGFLVLSKFLPAAAIIGFTAMILSGLVAAGSSALSAVSSIGATDFYRKIKPKASDKELLKASRVSMVMLILIGMGISLIPNIQLLYLVLAVGAFRAALFIPTVLSLFWNKLSAEYTFWGIILGMIVGVPLFIYGSITKNPNITSFGSLIPIIITLFTCVLGGVTNNRVFKFSSLLKK